MQAQLVTPKGSQVNVEYRLNHPQDRWTAYDVSVDGASLVGNYKTQFNHLLQRTSFADLLKTMRQKGARSRRVRSEPEAPVAWRGPGLRVRRLDPDDHSLEEPTAKTSGRQLRHVRDSIVPVPD